MKSGTKRNVPSVTSLHMHFATNAIRQISIIIPLVCLCARNSWRASRILHILYVCWWQWETATRKNLTPQPRSTFNLISDRLCLFTTLMLLLISAGKFKSNYDLLLESQYMGKSGTRHECSQSFNRITPTPSPHTAKYPSNLHIYWISARTHVHVCSRNGAKIMLRIFDSSGRRQMQNCRYLQATQALASLVVLVRQSFASRRFRMKQLVDFMVFLRQTRLVFAPFKNKINDITAFVLPIASNASQVLIAIFSRWTNTKFDVRNSKPSTTVGIAINPHRKTFS